MFGKGSCNAVLAVVESQLVFLLTMKSHCRKGALSVYSVLVLQGALGGKSLVTPQKRGYWDVDLASWAPTERCVDPCSGCLMSNVSRAARTASSSVLSFFQAESEAELQLFAV